MTYNVSGGMLNLNEPNCQMVTAAQW